MQNIGSIIKSITPIAFFASLLLISCPLIAADAPTLQMAPANPAFTDFMLHKPVLQGAFIQAKGMGYIPSPVDRSHLKELKQFLPLKALASLPSSYDLRTLGRVTPVRDQGGCGSCWSFGAMASLESGLLTGETRDFSENNLKNNHGYDWGPCDGGNIFLSTAYLMRWSGPVNETDDPYHDYDDTATAPTGLTVQKHAQNIIHLPPRTSSTDNDTIKNALITYGALTVSYYQSTAYYNDTYHTYYYSGSNNSNHEVAIVGWDDNFDKNKFSPAAPGNGAFIIKNSWGTSWGDNGYFYISYYDHSLGYSDLAVFTSPQSTTNYIRMYSYDPLGMVGNIGYGNTTAWFANIFTAQGNEKIAAVSFYNSSLNSPYEIYVYKNLTSAANPRSGTLAAPVQTGTLADSGYLTIPLSTPVDVTSGQSFSVVIKLTTPGLTYPIPVEYAISGYSSAASALSGQSFFSSSGTSWTDTTSYYSTMNVCLKAYAYSPATGVTLSPDKPSPQPLNTPGGVTFTAEGEGGSGSYEYQFRLSTDGGTTYSIVQEYSTSTTWTWDTSELTAGSNYRIFVGAKNAGSTTTTYEAYDELSYTLTNPPPTVTLIAPATGFVPGPIPLSAIATAGSGTITKVEYYNGGLLLGTCGPTTAPTYSFNWTNMTAGTYTLTAKVYNSLGATAVSAPVTVTVLISAPTAISPQGGGIATTPTYTFTAVTGATDYMVYGHDNTAGTDFNSGWVTSAAAGCPLNTGTCGISFGAPLTADHSYTWIVSGRNAAGQGPWSNYVTFTVGTVPVAPTAISPQGGGIATTPTYTFSPVTGATDYMVYGHDNTAGTDFNSGWVTSAAAGCPLNTGTCGISFGAPLTADHSYTWIVSGRNAAGQGPWSNYLTFTVGTVPVAPTAISPQGGGIATTPTYTFSPVTGTTDYMVYGHDNTAGTDFNSGWVTPEAAGCPLNTGTCGISFGAPLTADHSYTWIVSGRNAAGQGPWSNYLTFTVGTVPVAPTAISPQGGGITTTPTYTFSPVTGATDYMVYGHDNTAGTDFNSGWVTPAAAGCPLNTGTCGISFGAPLAADHSYTWIVSGRNAAGQGPWSNYLSFIVQ